MADERKKFDFWPELKEILRLPTTSFHETAVSDYVRMALDRMGIDYRLDRVGNIIARLERGSKRQIPLALVAHMDHPGFVVEKKISRGVALSRVMGGVGGNLTGKRIRFFTKPESVGQITKIVGRDARRGPARIHVSSRTELAPGTFGMWDVPVFWERGARIYSRAIDDVCGMAAMLEIMNRLRKNRAAPLHIYSCFTRAEEVGFVGAMALAKHRELPKDAQIISIEMSKAIPGKAEQGKGVVIRIGDRASIFDPRLCEFLIGVARKIQQKRRGFRFQTAVLDGGTCEATAFNRLGYRSASVALPLGNYHNRTPGAGVAAEYINRHDLQNLLDFLTAGAVEMNHFGRFEMELRTRLAKNFMNWKKFLRC